MKWYGAHLVEYLKYLDGKQDSYSVYENIVLIKAKDEKDAFAEAEKLGKKREVNITVGPDDRPARWTFAGVRILTECQDNEPETLEQPNNFRPSHGTEISYVALVVDSEEALTKLVNGEAVRVELEDARPVSEEVAADILGSYSESSI